MTRTLDLATVPAMELPPGWRRDQRWRNRRHAFLDPARTRFDPGDYLTGPVNDRDAKAFVTEHHYSGSYPSARLPHGLWSRATGELVGVAVLSDPQRAEVLTGVFPDLAPYTQAAELGRLVLLDSVGGNAETYLVARLFRAALAAGIRGVVSFSDPVARTDTTGRLVFVGHHGGVYQAGNALYLGRTRRRRKFAFPDGTELSERGIWKVIGDERGHGYVQRRLERWGAPPRRPGESGDAWIARALPAAGIRQYIHTGLHRYAWPLGATARHRAAVRIAMTPMPYPKPDRDPVQLGLNLDLFAAGTAAGGDADAA